jgi:hypothetical protein
MPVLVLCGFIVSGCVLFDRSGGGKKYPGRDDLSPWRDTPAEPERETQLAPVEEDDGLTDDRLADRPAPAFVPDLVDSRPLDKWQINASAAVLKLDVPKEKPDPVSVSFRSAGEHLDDPRLFALRPSYAAAVAAAMSIDSSIEILPSVNLLNGKAKQFDDGLYAALDRAFYRGVTDRLASHVEFVRRLYERVGPEGPAGAFLAAGLSLAGVEVEATDKAARDTWLKQFKANEVRSKPIGFYTWNEQLSSCFRFMRFFAREFDQSDLKVPIVLAHALEMDRELRADYEKILAFYARLTNPMICRSMLQLHTSPENFPHKTIALWPQSTSRETVLFEKLFPMGLPENANLMRELVQAIRSGKVDLRPTKDSGWYEYQVHALETMLLPERGPEGAKLLLTKEYKKRMLEAFKALITKQRETHVRQLAVADVPLSAAPPPFVPPPRPKVSPRLRVEPCPSFYLRTARAYAFLSNLLEAGLTRDTLRTLQGMKYGGVREPDLWTELQSMRDLFYGLYLISAEDLGMKPDATREELPDPDRCYRAAAAWLPKAFDDPDLAVDTRVAIPIATDSNRRVTRLWATLGVHLARLDAEYARPPSLRLATGGAWEVVAQDDLLPSHYLIAVDEFAEVELSGLRSLTRQEFRTACDRGKTREGILALLREGR